MNFLQAYEVWSGGNEAPEIYHKWTGLSVISSLVSRRIWCEQGQDFVMANLYLMLVGPAGNGKSTAMKIGRALVRKFNEFCPVPPKAQTYQSLIQDLGDEKQEYKKKFLAPDGEMEFSHASVFCNEFATLLKSDPLGWVTFLTDIYDDDSYEYKIKNPPAGGKKLDHIANPYITLLGCMTPELTASNLQEGIISTGFSRRCIFVFATRSRKSIPRRTTTPDQLEALDVCKKYANVLVRASGIFRWSQEAERVFDKWYDQNKKIIYSTADNFMSSWLNSKDQIIIKVSMLLSLSEDTKMILEPRHIQEALTLVNATEEHFYKIFAAAGRNPIAMLSTKLASLIDQHETPVAEKRLYKALHPHGNTAEINEAILHLVNIKELRGFQYQPRPGSNVTVFGRPQVVQDFEDSLKAKTAAPPSSGWQGNLDLSGFAACPPEENLADDPQG